jgi:hypothetical protein
VGLASSANFFHCMPFPLIFLPTSPSINILTLKSFLISTPTPHSLPGYMATVYCKSFLYYLYKNLIKKFNISTRFLLSYVFDCLLRITLQC